MMNTTSPSLLQSKSAYLLESQTQVLLLPKSLYFELCSHSGHMLCSVLLSGGPGQQLLAASSSQPQDPGVNISFFTAHCAEKCGP